jgi:hypothetical protein
MLKLYPEPTGSLPYPNSYKILNICLAITLGVSKWPPLAECSAFNMSINVILGTVIHCFPVHINPLVFASVLSDGYRNLWPASFRWFSVVKEYEACTKFYKLCVLYWSRNKERLVPYTAWTDGFPARSQNCEQRLLAPSCVSVYLSVCVRLCTRNKWDRIFIKFDIWEFFENLSINLKFD